MYQQNQQNDGQPQHSNIPWWEAYPKVKSSPAIITADELATMLRDISASKANFSVIDTRRTDFGGGFVFGATNHPAQSFYDDLETFGPAHSQIPKVIFYCSSSRGRGPRCAGWYQDWLDEHEITTSKAYVLEGGIKGWVEKFGREKDLTEQYNEDWWKSQ